jgi:hypothetical protein
MNRTFSSALVLVAAAVAAGNVLADDYTLENTPFVSTASRAQVVAELAAFRAAGIDPWAIDYNPVASFSGSLSREQVTADYLAHREAVAAFTSEDSGSSYLARNGADAQADVIRLARQE